MTDLGPLGGEVGYDGLFWWPKYNSRREDLWTGILNWFAKVVLSLLGANKVPCDTNINYLRSRNIRGMWIIIIRLLYRLSYHRPLCDWCNDLRRDRCSSWGYPKRYAAVVGRWSWLLKGGCSNLNVHERGKSNWTVVFHNGLTFCTDFGQHLKRIQPLVRWFPCHGISNTANIASMLAKFSCNGILVHLSTPANPSHLLHTIFQHPLLGSTSLNDSNRHFRSTRFAWDTKIWFTTKWFVKGHLAMARCTVDWHGRWKRSG